MGVSELGVPIFGLLIIRGRHCNGILNSGHGPKPATSAPTIRNTGTSNPETASSRDASQHHVPAVAPRILAGRQAVQPASSDASLRPKVRIFGEDVAG